MAQNLTIVLNSAIRNKPVVVTDLEGRLAAIVDLKVNLGAGRLLTSSLRRRVNVRD